MGGEWFAIVGTMASSTLICPRKPRSPNITIRTTLKKGMSDKMPQYSFLHNNRACRIIARGVMVQYENGQIGFAKTRDIQPAWFHRDDTLLRLAADIVFSNTGRLVSETSFKG